MAELTIDGFVCLFDDEDLPALCETLMPWRIHKGTRGGGPYLVRTIESYPHQRVQAAHRFLCPDVRADQEVDHINRNGLDNRKSNLRVCERWQNKCNRGVASHNQCGFKGVQVDDSRPGRRYRARITAEGKRYRLGSFSTPEDAARAYDEAAIRLHGEFAVTNQSLGLI